VQQDAVPLVAANDKPGLFVEREGVKHGRVQAAEQRELVVAGGGDHEPKRTWALVHGRVERVEELDLLARLPRVQLVDDHRRGVQAVGDEAVCGDRAQDATVQGVADLMPSHLQHVEKRARLDEAARVLEDDAGLVTSSGGEDDVRLVVCTDELP
jgi:hypothetical protein